MNRLFDDFFRGFELSSLHGGRLWAESWPKLDVSETDNEFEITAELPGMDEKDVDVTLAGDVLRICGQKKNKREERRKNYYLAERTYGRFHRDIPLLAEVDAEKIDARFNKGVLTVRLPKVKDSRWSRRVPVRTATR
jgi:HSP20 family protein